MPRPKPPEPYVSIVARLTPDQAGKLRQWASANGKTVADAIRIAVERLSEPAATVAPPEAPKPSMRLPVASPGSRLKKR